MENSKYRTDRIGIRVTSRFTHILKQAAKKMGLSKTELIERAVIEYIDDEDQSYHFDLEAIDDALNHRKTQ